MKVLDGQRMGKALEEVVFGAGVGVGVGGVL
jgi:hypothetical protein